MGSFATDNDLKESAARPVTLDRAFAEDPLLSSKLAAHTIVLRYGQNFLGE